MAVVGRRDVEGQPRSKLMRGSEVLADDRGMTIVALGWRVVVTATGREMLV